MAYHNDLHGADVMQMVYVMLTKGGLIEMAGILHLSCVASIVAAACHDYDHDGLNNTYHKNAFTNRAIRYHDQSIQENYHAAESFQILLKPEFNFLHEMPRDSLKIFHQRFFGVILATDMAKHMEDLTHFKNRLNLLGITSEAKNGHLYVDRTSSKTLFDT